jgi:RimJ/RimL family protein N-acetyltransferase
MEIMRKQIETEFEVNKNFVLQRIGFDKRIVRNIKATNQMIHDDSIMTYFCAIPRTEGKGFAANVLNYLFAAVTIATLAREPHNYVVVEKASGKIAACVALRPEGNAGWALSAAAFEPYRKRGLIFAAAQKVLSVARVDHRVQEITALSLPENEPATRSLLRAGFEKVGTTSSPKTWYRQKGREDVAVWTLPRDKALASLGL